MKIKPSQMLTWVGLCFTLLLIGGTAPAHPVVAATIPASALDVVQIDTFVRAQVQRHGIPGLALAVVEGDQVVHLKGFGSADETGRAVTPQTPFILASASKPLTALAVMQLVEAGMVALDAPVQRYLPDFRLADSVASQEITVRHLLQHTSGIPEQGCQNSRFGTESLEEFVAALRTIKLSARPGARYFYCSGNYNVLGRIIEVVSGQSFAAYIEQHVFAPLEMRHSFTSQEVAKQHGLAQGYSWIFGVPMPSHYRFDPPQLPSGFLIASAEDMANFLVAQLNGGQFGSASILSPEGIAAMQAPGVAMGAHERTYGLGWRTELIDGVPTINHPGDHPNTHTLVLIEPKTRRGVVLLVNASGWLPLLGTFTEIETGVVRLLAGQQPAPTSSLSLGMRYFILDAVIGGLLVLALWPLVRLRHWYVRMHQQADVARLRFLRISMRLTWEFGLPLALLGGARLLLDALGAQSWAEGLLLFPDFGVWLWVLSLLILFTGMIRLALTLRLLRRTMMAGSAASRKGYLA